MQCADISLSVCARATRTELNDIVQSSAATWDVFKYLVSDPINPKINAYLCDVYDIREVQHVSVPA